MFECDVWDFPETFAGMRFRRNWLERQEFYNGALSRHRLIFGGRLSGLEDARTPEKLYRAFSDCKGAALWGEKSPFYCARLRQVARRHPGCSFVLLWRDPVEIYRSVVHAGHWERFFRRRGMLSRLIFYQEQMLRQAAELSRDGVRIHHVSYADLIDKTEDVLRNLCGFLGIEFSRSMLDLAHADFSAVYRAPQHDFLRRGRIERHQFLEDVPARSVEKLERFRARWQRLSGMSFDPRRPAGGREPSFGERLYHKLVGSLIRTLDDAKRVLFEFLPLPWLRTYRQAAQWLFAGRGHQPVERLSVGQQLSAHWITLLTSALILAGVGMVDYLTSPNMVFGPFYLIPCAAVTLVINSGWGTLAAISSAIVLTAVRLPTPLASMSVGLEVWNVLMRFAVFEIVVVLLDRMRIEMNASGQRNM